MRLVIQRVSRASVTVDGTCVGAIGSGLLVFVGVGIGDDDRDAHAAAEKIAHLRIFEDENGLMNRSVLDVNGQVLLVSQFTLHGDARKGRRPSFIGAARENVAKPLYERVGALTAANGVGVAYGVFGADMQVDLVNAGPVTLLIDTKKLF